MTLLRTLSLALAFFITGCTTYSPPVPESYTGPTAHLEDSYTEHSSAKVDFFFVEEIEGAKVDNALASTLRFNRGKGMRMTPMSWYRPLMAQKPMKVKVKARTHHAAPILAIVRTVYEVSGVIEFVPEPNAKYVVRGELGDEYSAVWIEDAKTKQVVGNKIELKGSAKLGIFQK
jgi:hypothetical protein